MTKKNYGKLSDIVYIAYSTLAEACIRRVGAEFHNEIKKIYSSDKTDRQFTVACIWQKRWFSF